MMDYRRFLEWKDESIPRLKAAWHKVRWDRTLWAAPLIVLSIWYAYPNWILHQLLPIVLKMDDGNWAVRGQIGDSFGAFNALFSGLGIAGLAINIYLQNVQIKKLEKEEDQNKEMLQKQVSVMRLTALLQYYDGQIGPIEKQIFELDQEIGKIIAEHAKHIPGFSNISNQDIAAVLGMRGFYVAASSIDRVSKAQAEKQKKLEGLTSARQQIFDELNNTGK